MRSERAPFVLLLHTLSAGLAYKNIPRVTQRKEDTTLNNLIYIIGLIVVVVFILKFLGLW
jgi:hypothetical protein